MSINKVILIGNVGQDPDIRNTSDGREIANFSLATTESWKDKNSGERKDKTEWHRIVVFSQGLVNIVKNYVKKGSKLYIEGQLQTRKWTDNNGIEKFTTEVVLQNYSSTLQMLDSNRPGSASGFTSDSDQNSGSTNNSKSKVSNNSDNFAQELDDDIPF